jgi:hypothetical protein
MFYLYLSLIDPPHAALRASTNPFFAISLLRSKFGVDFGYHPLPIFSAKSIFQPQAASGRPRFFLSSRLTSSCPVSRLLSLGVAVDWIHHRCPLRPAPPPSSIRFVVSVDQGSRTTALFDRHCCHLRPVPPTS